MAARDPERYGTRHRMIRAAWAPSVARGECVCVVIGDTGCGKPILPGQRWDLGHVPGGAPDEYAGPQHARCNRAAGARNGNRQRRQVKLRTSEDW